jgi:hypothetical protein
VRPLSRGGLVTAIGRQEHDARSLVSILLPTLASFRVSSCRVSGRALISRSRRKHTSRAHLLRFSVACYQSLQTQRISLVQTVGCARDSTDRFDRWPIGPVFELAGPHASGQRCEEHSPKSLEDDSIERHCPARADPCALATGRLGNTRRSRSLARFCDGSALGYRRGWTRGV